MSVAWDKFTLKNCLWGHAQRVCALALKERVWEAHFSTQLARFYCGCSLIYHSIDPLLLWSQKNPCASEFRTLPLANFRMLLKCWYFVLQTIMGMISSYYGKSCTLRIRTKYMKLNPVRSCRHVRLSQFLSFVSWLYVFFRHLFHLLFTIYNKPIRKCLQ